MSDSGEVRMPMDPGEFHRQRRKVYEGNGRTRKVTVNGRPLAERTDLRHYSHIGFDWGYHGRGAMQLALAILCDYFHDDNKALMYECEFRWMVICKLPQGEHFTLTDVLIEKQLSTIRGYMGRLHREEAHEAE